MHMRRLIVLIALLGAACGSSATLTNTGTSSSTSPSPTPSPTQSGAVTIVPGASSLTKTAFDPNPLTVSVGATVTWTNADSITHTSVSDNGTWNSGNIVPGATFTRTFTAAGSFTYHCAIHPNMVGTVTVQ